MASFRFRVVGPAGVVGGFPSVDLARLFAEALSQQTGAAVSVFEYPHGAGKAGSIQVAGYVNGTEYAIRRAAPDRLTT